MLTCGLYDIVGAETAGAGEVLVLAAKDVEAVLALVKAYRSYPATAHDYVVCLF